MEEKILLAIAMMIIGGFMFYKMSAIKNMVLAVIVGILGLGVGIGGLVLLVETIGIAAGLL